MINLSILPQLVLLKVCLKQEDAKQNITSTGSNSECYTKIDEVMLKESKQVSCLLR